MGIRNRHKIGDHLMLDDESGFVHYRSDMREIWDGTWRHKDNFETRQPQEFIRAKTDPKALRDVRPEPAVAPICEFTSPTVGTTNTPTTPTNRTNFAGIGSMTIGGDCGPFFVYSKEQVK